MHRGELAGQDPEGGKCALGYGWPLGKQDAARPVLQPRCLEVKIDGTEQHPEILMGVGADRSRRALLMMRKQGRMRGGRRRPAS